MGPRAGDGASNRGGGGLSSKEPDSEAQALGSPYQTHERRRKPLGCLKTPLETGHGSENAGALRKAVDGGS